MICRLRGGTWVPFDVETVAAADDHPEAHLPMRTGDLVALVPVAEVAPRNLAGVRWFAKRHRCAEFYRAKAEERERVDGMTEVAEQLAQHFGRALQRQ